MKLTYCIVCYRQEHLRLTFGHGFETKACPCTQLSTYSNLNGDIRVEGAHHGSVFRIRLVL